MSGASFPPPQGRNRGPEGKGHSVHLHPIPQALGSTQSLPGTPVAHGWPSPHCRPTTGCVGHFKWSWWCPHCPSLCPRGSLFSASANTTGNSTSRAGWKPPRFSKEPQFLPSVSHPGHCREPRLGLGMEILMSHHLHCPSHLAWQVNAQQCISDSGQKQEDAL